MIVSITGSSRVDTGANSSSMPDVLEEEEVVVPRWSSIGGGRAGREVFAQDGAPEEAIVLGMYRPL